MKKKIEGHSTKYLINVSQIHQGRQKEGRSGELSEPGGASEDEEGSVGCGALGARILEPKKDVRKKLRKSE